MFLDEILLKETLNFKIIEPKDFEILLNKLYLLTENSYKFNLTKNQPKKVVKSNIDRAFKSWDLFILSLKKENYFLVDLIEKYTYKINFFENEKLKEIYYSL
ncbi:MAG TPA: hypothetical protein VIK86_05615 [Candidatus Paceibacterota bacterium]